MADQAGGIDEGGCDMKVSVSRGSCALRLSGRHESEAGTRFGRRGRPDRATSCPSPLAWTTRSPGDRRLPPGGRAYSTLGCLSRSHIEKSSAGWLRTGRRAVAVWGWLTHGDHEPGSPAQKYTVCSS